ncbi:hypothetical protein JCM14722_14250 [Pseudodesulfovibrio portus]|uniref:Solute-binding protein family 3/N-terminal domain-containing protein n=1 Tax=Pseudodesulfovibrio portus TaxID=231439 RepID=A0ABN6RVX8_9BACT|nr:hypothetical protein JCM14722_14250 [Pseudodesulfovibrio portus]
MLVTNEYYPYVSLTGDNPGMLYEVVAAAFREVQVEARIECRPWRRCALMVEDGTAFGAFPYARTPRREAYAWFSDVIGECRNAFFFLKGRMAGFSFTGLDALRPYTLAGTSGHFYEEAFERAGLRVDYAPGEASGVHKVRMMRVDLFAEDEMVGWNLIHRIFPSQAHLFSSSTAWNVNPQHVMVSKRYPEAERLMERFNRGLAAIRENGVYDRIESKYFPR